MTWISAEDVAELLEQIGLDLTPWEGDGTYPKIQGIIEECENRIESECQRKFDPAVKTETFNGPGSDRLVLAEYPVIRIISVLIFGAAQPESSFTVDSERGILYATSGRFPRGIQNVRVEYEYGYGSIPLELKNILTKLAAREVIMRSPSEDGATGIKSIRILNYSVSYNGGLFSRQVEEWSAEAKDVLRRYKKVVIR
jgi:hypothetical protein